jgi:2-polyprenyl-6-methoxyphenol hydroxylase-like FAD-dependent oxidoreductase
VTPRSLIVGAGVAGLALARALRPRDITAEVVERMPEWEASGSGLFLPGNSVRALDELGSGPSWLLARTRSCGSGFSTTVAAGSPTSTFAATGTVSQPVSRFAERPCTRPSARGAPRFRSDSDSR